MPICLRLPTQMAGLSEYFKVQYAEVLVSAGPPPVKRTVERSVVYAPHRISVDIGYPFPEATTIYAWYYYHAQDSLVEVGDMLGLIMRNVSGALEVIHVLGMSQDMDGKGVWEHLVNPPPASPAGQLVEAGDMIGFYVAAAPGDTGVPPLPTYDEVPGGMGSYDIDLNASTPVPVQGASYAFGTSLDQAEATNLRLSVQARGETPSLDGVLSYTTIDDGDNAHYNGDGAILNPAYQATMGSSTTAPEYYVETVSGSVLLDHDRLFNLSESGTQVILPANSVANVYLRLVDGASTQRIGKVVFGISNSIRHDAGWTAKLSYSMDDTDINPQNISDWTDFYLWPEDGSFTADQQFDHMDHVPLCREVKWLKLMLGNSSASTAQFDKFLAYPFTSAEVGADGKFTPNYDDMYPEYFWVTQEGVTFLVTTEADLGQAEILVENALEEDFDGIANGQSIWIRAGTSPYARKRYTVSAVDFGTTKITLTTNLEELVPAGSFLDTRILALKVTMYDSGDRAIRESPPLLAAGTFREKFIRGQFTITPQ